MVERQMLPKQTKSTDTGSEDMVLTGWDAHSRPHVLTDLRRCCCKEAEDAEANLSVKGGFGKAQLPEMQPST